jgi:signal transduction histidine kinase
LRKPLDPTLKVEEQLIWLRDNAYVAESNLTYQRLNRQIGLSDEEARQWRADLPWAAPFIQHLGAAAPKDYVMDGLQFNVQIDRHQATYITAFRGVMEGGTLVRIWGVARDVTELAELNEQLKQKQERLKQYARELVGAEERARRATAVDLHDGIGQQLVGLSMTLNAMAARSPPEIKLLLSEATNTLREVQDMAQRVIADLSPPGLYELGLEPALKWLSVYMRSKDSLEVQLAIDVVESDLSLELRVLAFKVIRELLRNVVKHAGVLSARVTVTHSDRELHATVEDSGVGFEWQLSLFEPREHGFGLWSIADRVRDAAGEMQVDTSPGRGCRVSLVFPLTLAVAARRYGAQNDGGLRTGNAG